MRKFIPLLVLALFVAFCNPTITANAAPIEQKLVVGETLSSSGGHSCAVMSAGLVRCWGDNEYGETNVPSDLGAVTQVSAGFRHSCALTVSGLVRCWGDNEYGETNVPSDLGAVAQVSSGYAHSCAVTSAGRVACWGSDRYGQTVVPSDLGAAVQVSAGFSHSCAETVSGLWRCWGSNLHGETSVPSDLGAVAQVSAGAEYSCALTVSGLVRCWGYNESGQTDVPSDLGGVVQVSAGFIHSCAVTSAGRVACWGSNRYGQASVPSDLGGVVQVSLGYDHSCAVTSAGLVRCWGANGRGQTNANPSLVVTVSSGSNHRCAVASAGRVVCWGWDSYGQARVPSDLGAAVQVSAGGGHSCAVTSAGRVACWGYNGYGQASVPSDLGAAVQVSAGEEYSCAVTSAGLVRCWGDSLWGPGRVPSDLGAVSQVSAGRSHSCALTVTGLVRCWGWDSYGQARVPSDLGAAVQVSAGGGHSCAVTSVGLVRCWGANGFGQTSVPPDLGAVVQVSAGDNHSCAVTSAGLVRCWGYNAYGQASVPSDLGAALQVGAGRATSCAVTSAGLVRCWGENGYVPNDVYANGSSIVFKQPRILAISTIVGTIVGEFSLGAAVRAEFNVGADGFLSHQWFRNGLLISNATQATYTITEEDFAASLTVKALFRDSNNIYIGESTRTVEFPSFNFSAPTVSGMNSLGSMLSATVDGLDPEATFSYQWLRNGEDIAGATSSTYSLKLVDLAQNLSVRVTGSKERFNPTTRTSAGSRISSVIPNSPCVGNIDTTSSWVGTSSQPSIVGIPTFGQSLKGSNGSWSPGTKFCVFWIADGVVAPQATSSTYKLQGSEVGKNVQFVVVGIDKSSKRTARISDPLLVTKAKFTSARAPLVKGPARVGTKLSSSLSSWGTGTSYSYQWFRDSSEILNATASSYIPTAFDASANLTLRVCGRKENFETSCLDSVSQIASLGLISKVGQVSIGGTSTNVGATFIANTTQWMTGAELTWQWLRNGEDIAGAIGNSYTITSLDRGKTIGLRVTGHAEGYQNVSKLSKDKKIP